MANAKDAENAVNFQAVQLRANYVRVVTRIGFYAILQQLVANGKRLPLNSYETTDLANLNASKTALAAQLVASGLVP